MHESWHVFVLNDSVIQDSLNIPDTSGVKLNNYKKEFVSCLVIGEKPSKGNTKGILLGKLNFMPTTSVIVILQRLKAFSCKNCSFQL